MNQRKHLFSPQEAPVFRRRIGPELNDLHIFRIIFIYLLPQMPSRSPKGEAPVRVARRKARPRAPSDAFRPILPPAEARAGNKQLKIGRPGTRRLEIGRLWKGLIGDWRCLSMPGAPGAPASLLEFVLKKAPLPHARVGLRRRAR